MNDPTMEEIPPEDEDNELAALLAPHEYEFEKVIMCGTGKGVDNNIGNVNFRDNVDFYREEFPNEDQRGLSEEQYELFKAAGWHFLKDGQEVHKKDAIQKIYQRMTNNKSAKKKRKAESQEENELPGACAVSIPYHAWLKQMYEKGVSDGIALARQGFELPLPASATMPNSVHPLPLVDSLQIASIISWPIQQVTDVHDAQALVTSPSGAFDRTSTMWNRPHFPNSSPQGMATPARLGIPAPQIPLYQTGNALAHGGSEFSPHAAVFAGTSTFPDHLHPVARPPSQTAVIGSRGNHQGLGTNAEIAAAQVLLASPNSAFGPCTMANPRDYRNFIDQTQHSNAVPEVPAFVHIHQYFRAVDGDDDYASGTHHQAAAPARGRNISAERHYGSVTTYTDNAGTAFDHADQRFPSITSDADEIPTVEPGDRAQTPHRVSGSTIQAQSVTPSPVAGDRLQALAIGMEGPCPDSMAAAMESIAEVSEPTNKTSLSMRSTSSSGSLNSLGMGLSSLASPRTEHNVLMDSFYRTASW